MIPPSIALAVKLNDIPRTPALSDLTPRVDLLEEGCTYDSRSPVCVKDREGLPENHSCLGLADGW